WMVQTTPINDNEKISALCRSLTGATRPACFGGLGMANFGPVARHPETFGAVCPAEPEADRTLCIEGTIEPLSGMDVKAAAIACRRLPGAARPAGDAPVSGGRYRLANPSMPLSLEGAASGAGGGNSH